MAKNSFHLVQRSKDLRQNSTDAERRLWHLLRGRQLGDMKFRRQHVFGPYVIDFFCFEAHLAVEVDGGQHKSEHQIAKDQARTRYLEEKGVRVIRFTNLEVLNEPQAVAEVVREALGVPAP